jgi:hypothetical protein
VRQPVFKPVDLPEFQIGDDTPLNDLIKNDNIDARCK